MGPLQYLVVGYDQDHFRDDLIPELTSLSERQVIRMLDLLIVKRDETGRLSSLELTEILPDEGDLLSRPDHDEWITQDDVDVAGENLPNGSSVALLFFEHAWANRLEDVVMQAGRFLGDDESAFPDVSSRIEQLLATGVVAHAR
jgi:hypothetical protein